jgi:hypothetical protein
MYDITVHKLNESYIKIDCESGISKELHTYFSFRVPGYQFTPAYKNKVWDGFIRLYSLRDNTLYHGLFFHIKKFCEDRKYNLMIDPEVLLENKLSVNEANDFISKLKLPYEVRDYQQAAFIHAIRKKRSLILSPTASGKSLILYLIVRYLQVTNKKGVLIVPTTHLVEQMYSDFASYGYDSKKYCHRQYSGKDKQSDKFLTITTWQSIYKNSPEYFEQFDFVLGDEAHQFKAKSLTTILSSLVNAKYRIGCTGTLDGTQCFDGNTLINTFNGKKKIKDITRNDKVLTFNENNKSLEYKSVLNKFNNGVSKKMLKIKTMSGEIIVTPDHKICTKDGWKAANDLTLNDEIICIN